MNGTPNLACILRIIVLIYFFYADSGHVDNSLFVKRIFLQIIGMSVNCGNISDFFFLVFFLECM